MKIYNEVTSTFNDVTGQWETVFEDSFNYDGPVSLAQGLPPNATVISAQDTVADTVKTTAGYFTNGDGTLGGSDVHTGSLSDSNELYYYNVTQAHTLSASAATQFSVTFGHINGSGSNQFGDSTTNNKNIIGETQAIYKQYTNLLLEENDARVGFKISAHQGGTGAIAAGVKDDYIYIWNGKRERFKDRVNKKAWTLLLSGSDTLGSGAPLLSLTDDSKTVAAIATPGGPRYNIISGALGVASPAQASGYLSKNYGWFYPEMGCMVFSGAELSASIPGNSAGIVATASFDVSHADTNFLNTLGFGPNLDAKRNSQNALRFVNCMSVTSKDGATHNTWRLRSEEDQTQENYFCRIKAAEYNFSANPTFTSGGLNKIRNITMHGNPSTFITGLGLYNSSGQLIATAKLSSPLKKNFASEATIKVKLTY